jgi:DDE superfamily endonuclease
MRASQTIDGAMTGKKFLAYVEGPLAPTLKRRDIVMIDNLPAHNAAGVGEAIEARGATLRYLPKYSPDLNPIEMSFSKQAQGPSARGCRADNSSPAPSDRPIHAYPHAPRSFQLFQARRLCVKSNGICSSLSFYRWCWTRKSAGGAERASDASDGRCATSALGPCASKLVRMRQWRMSGMPRRLVNLRFIYHHLLKTVQGRSQLTGTR